MVGNFAVMGLIMKHYSTNFATKSVQDTLKILYQMKAKAKGGEDLYYDMYVGS